MIRIYNEPPITIFDGDAHAIVDPSLERGDFPELVGKVVITDPPYGASRYSTDKRPTNELYEALITQPRTCALFGWPEDLVGLCMDLAAHAGKEGRAIPRPVEWVTWWPKNKCHPRSSNLREAECVAIFGEVPGVRRMRRPRSASGRELIERIERTGRDDALRKRVSGGDILTAQDGDVWAIDAPGIGFNGGERLHMNEKPLSLMHKLVELCSEPDDTIIDPFCGSGTTLVAARDLGRRAIGVELDAAARTTTIVRLHQQVLPMQTGAL